MANPTGPNSPATDAVVTIYTRHTDDCPYKEDSFYKRCKCRKTLRYFLNGKRYRISAKTRTWSVAEEARRALEDRLRGAEYATEESPHTPTKGAVQTIGKIAELFVLDKRSQGLEESVLKKYQRELERFADFMRKRSKHFPKDIRLQDLTEYRSTWLNLYPSSTTRSKVQERLRAYLRYCYESNLIERVPKLSPIKVDEAPTMPLSESEYRKLLDVTPNEFPTEKATRVRALIQLMRFSGLAIRDAVTLQRTDLVHDTKNKLYRIVTSRQKTGTHVSVPIPKAVAEEVLAAMKLNDSEKYIFWKTGKGKPQTAVTNWQHDLRQIFRSAGQPNGHPHQLRDTFAVSLLEKGVPLEEVSKLLGHESIKTTEKYYAKWVKARQDRLDSLVVGTWN